MFKYEERIIENCLRDEVGFGFFYVILVVIGMGVVVFFRRLVILVVCGIGF